MAKNINWGLPTDTVEVSQLFALQIANLSGPLVSVKVDGTVIVHREGADKEAAKMFYDALQFEGKTLRQRIKDLETRVHDLEQELEDERSHNGDKKD